MQMLNMTVKAQTCLVGTEMIIQSLIYTKERDLGRSSCRYVRKLLFLCLCYMFKSKSLCN